MKNIILIITYLILSCELFVQNKLFSNTTDFHDYHSNWIDENSYDTLVVKVLEYIPNFSICGGRPAESLTIGYIPRQDTIRIFVLYDIDSTNWVGRYRTFVADERPSFPTSAGNHHHSKYNNTVSKTVWGYFIDGR